MSTYHYSEEQRNDPELRAKVAKVIKARQDALAEAAQKLQEAVDILRPLSIFDGDAIYQRSYDATWRAFNQVSGDAAFMGRPTTETYIGNKAASELGDQILRLGDNFNKYFPEEKL